MNDLNLFTFVTIDENGDCSQITWTQQELFKKIPTLERRDLYLIDKKFLFKISSMNYREKTVLIKLDYIRCIIYNKVAYIVSGIGHDTLVDFRLYKLYNSMINSIVNNKNTMKFKLKVLEEIFINVSDYFENNIEEIAPKVSIISNDLDTDHITTTGNKNFINMNNNLLSLQTRLKDIYELFDRISSDNENRDSNYKNIEGDDERTKKITFYDLIDTYGNIFEDNYKDAKELLDMLSVMLKITNTKLDFNRNRLSMFNIYLDIIMIGITVSSLIAAIFGMNIPNKLESNGYAFFIVVSFIILIIIITLVLTKFIQKMIIK